MDEKNLNTFSERSYSEALSVVEIDSLLKFEKKRVRKILMLCK